MRGLVRGACQSRPACRDLGDVIEAIDVNPFLVCEGGAFALDGLVVLRPPPAQTASEAVI